MRAIEFITEDKIQKGINIRVDGDVDYAGLIADGKKKYETRNSNSLKPYIGKTVAIVRTGLGPATAIGQVTIGIPIVADETTFEKLRKQHLVPAGSKFDITQGGIKYLYPMLNPKRWDEEKPVTHHGIVARQVQWESKTITENLITHGDNQFKIERLEPGDEEYADMKVSVLDDWGNEAGFAKFASDGKDLDPRALKVHDRYRGQGFAKLIYDFMKSKGYRIVRSWDQTDDGKHFWDKNRGEDVRVWEE